MFGARWWAWAALAASVVFFAAGQAWLSPHYGWWHDEIYSMWASAPTSPWDRVVADSNPPGYFLLLRLARMIVGDVRIAVMLISVLSIAGAVAFVVRTGRAAGHLDAALLASALFIASGVTMFFSQEARAFLLGACIGLVAVWTAALSLLGKRPNGWQFILALAGAAAALTHFYAALLAGCVGAALVAYGLVGRKRELIAPGLVLGAASSIVFGVWFLMASGRLDRIEWITFSLAEVRSAIWVVRSLTVGPAWALVPVAMVFGYGAVMRQDLRPMLAVLAFAAALFVLIPVAISFKMPIIVGRYWCVGLSLLAVPLAVMIVDFASTQGRLQRAALALAALCVLIGSVSGLTMTRRFLVEEPTFSFAARVGALAQGCAPTSIVVPDFLKLYATASGLPDAVFRLPDRNAAAPGGSCPVVAWAEEAPPTTTMAGMLAVVGLPGSGEGLRAERTATGFILLRGDP